MSLLAQYRETEEALRELESRLEALKGDESLQKDIEFEEMIRTTMDEYGKKPSDVIAMLDPSYRAAEENKQVKATRRERQVKTYLNPHTGERIETKGGNHKLLKEWRQKWGSEVVDGWLQS